jgi:hypothetical protein
VRVRSGLYETMKGRPWILFISASSLVSHSGVYFVSRSPDFHFRKQTCTYANRILISVMAMMALQSSKSDGGLAVGVFGERSCLVRGAARPAVARQPTFSQNAKEIKEFCTAHTAELEQDVGEEVLARPAPSWPPIRSLSAS